MLIPLQNLLAKIMETIVSEKAYQCSHCTISLLFYPKHTLNMCLCFSFRLWCHKREKRKQRYLIIAPPLIISAPSDSELLFIYLFY